MEKTDWHSAPLHRDMLITPDFRVSQNVRRFMAFSLGLSGPLKIPRAFHLWLKTGQAKTLGDVIDEWQRRYGE